MLQYYINLINQQEKEQQSKGSGRKSGASQADELMDPPSSSTVIVVDEPKPAVVGKPPSPGRKPKKAPRSEDSSDDDEEKKGVAKTTPRKNIGARTLAQVEAERIISTILEKRPGRAEFAVDQAGPESTVKNKKRVSGADDISESSSKSKKRVSEIDEPEVHADHPAAKTKKAAPEVKESVEAKAEPVPVRSHKKKVVPPPESSDKSPTDVSTINHGKKRVSESEDASPRKKAGKTLAQLEAERIIATIVHRRPAKPEPSPVVEDRPTLVSSPVVSPNGSKRGPGRPPKAAPTVVEAAVEVVKPQKPVINDPPPPPVESPPTRQVSARTTNSVEDQVAKVPKPSASKQANRSNPPRREPVAEAVERKPVVVQEELPPVLSEFSFHAGPKGDTEWWRKPVGLSFIDKDDELTEALAALDKKAAAHAARRSPPSDDGIVGILSVVHYV